MNVEAEVELTGEERTHLVRIEFDFTIAVPPPRVRMSRYDATLCDPGEGGSAEITSAWAILKREDREPRERKLPEKSLERLRNDERLTELLYEIGLKEMPYE